MGRIVTTKCLTCGKSANYDEEGDFDVIGICECVWMGDTHLVTGDYQGYAMASWDEVPLDPVHYGIFLDDGVPVSVSRVSGGGMVFDKLKTGAIKHYYSSYLMPEENGMMVWDEVLVGSHD